MDNRPRELWVSATDKLNHVTMAVNHVREEILTDGRKMVVVSTQDAQTLSSARIFVHQMEKGDMEVIDKTSSNFAKLGLGTNPSGISLSSFMAELDDIHPDCVRVIFCNDTSMIERGVDSRTRGEIPIPTSFGPGSLFYIFQHDDDGPLRWGFASYDPSYPDL